MQIIGNRYEIHQELGVGGMGTVFLGLDKQTQAKVAIKQLKKELSYPEMLERFQREGQALRDLNHPNIVKLLDAVEGAGQPYLIMEYVAGGDLRQLLEKGSLPYQRTLNIAIDLADALTRAHRLNIIHRDLKPANVLVAEDGTIRLTDFGVARVVDKERVTQADAIVGTLDYLPPEAINGDPIDDRSDIWAFGVMLFEMLAGQRPFVANGYIPTMHAILTTPIPDLEELSPDSPIALVDLVYRMLARDPQARISSVRYVGAELEEILKGRDSRPLTRRFETPSPDFRQRPKHNLPAQTTAFVGRESELTELARMLSNPAMRLMTIVAQGGMGKTRLSLEAAERQIANFEHGVYFVELAPLSEAEGIIPAIANVLGYQFQSDRREQKQQLCDFLQAKELLLVLDNFEHLLDGARLISDLLKAAPKLKILATSRQRLDQAGESLFHLYGMDFPKWETPADALEYAAVKLFMNSALRAKPDFELTADNLDDVARICKLVQGVPLGIVLAASWLGILAPKEISFEIQKGLEFLESDSQQIPERQRSMRAVMEYSWQQMSEVEQSVFAKLSVFRGGFTREAAEVVAGASLRILMGLMNKSLLHRDSITGRYEIHELLRQYAEEKGQIKSIRDVHCRYFAEWMKAREKALKGNRDLDALREIYNDYENIKLAWTFAVERHHFDQIEQMFEPLSVFIFITSQTREGRTLFQPAITLKTSLSLHAKLLRAYEHGFSDLDESERNLRESLKIAQAHNDRIEEGIVLYVMALWMSRQSKHIEEAKRLIDESISLLSPSDEYWYLARAHFIKAYIFMEGNELEPQAVWYEEMQKARAIFQSVSNSSGQSSTLNNIAVFERNRGNYQLSIDLLQEYVKYALITQNMRQTALGHYNLSMSYSIVGDYALALEAAEKSVVAAQDYWDIPLLIQATTTLSFVLLRLGSDEEASRKCQSAYPLLEEIQNPEIRDNSYVSIRFSEALIAYETREHQKGIAFLEECLELLSKTNTPDVILRTFLAFFQIRVEDWTNATSNILASLPYINHIDMEFKFWVIYGLAAIAYGKGQTQLAIQYAAMVQHHYGSGFEFKQYATELLAKLKGELPAAEYQAVYERGKSRDLGELIQEILAQEGQ
jgi:serine/threonine protein kinase/tetratricopeptide (TPR) repeat protein